MNCRKECGVCCIDISISSDIPGMPGGKPAGVRCIHLTEDLRCNIFDHADRPLVCSGFKPDILFCGNKREDAQKTAEWLMN